MSNIARIILFISFFIVIACAENMQTIVVEQLTKSTKSWNGEMLPNYPSGQPEITILRIKIPAGAKLDLHKHPVINGGVLLKGELTVITEDNKILHLRAGDSIVEVVNKDHYGKNEGSDTAEIIVFYAGEEGKPITIKQ
jgi:quercetin dioxygenase-like cupin family protein